MFSFLSNTTQLISLADFRPDAADVNQWNNFGLHSQTKTTKTPKITHQGLPTFKHFFKKVTLKNFTKYS